ALDVQSRVPAALRRVAGPRPYPPQGPRSAGVTRPAASERAAQASPGGDGGAVVAHPAAFDRAEHAQAIEGGEVDGAADQPANAAGGAGLARRHEGEVLSEQHRGDRGVADPLEPDRTDMHAGLQRVV